MGIIIDTCVLIDFEKGKFDLPSLLRNHMDAGVAIASMTAAELFGGIEYATSPAIKKRRKLIIEKLINEIPIINFGIAEARQYAVTFAKLKIAGLTIDKHNLIIGVSAITHGYKVATTNLKDFEKIHGLKIENIGKYYLK